MTTSPQVYISFPGTAREALMSYAELFGGELMLHTFQDFGRTDGSSELIAHGEHNGIVSLRGSNAAEREPVVRVEGLIFGVAVG